MYLDSDSLQIIVPDPLRVLVSMRSYSTLIPFNLGPPVINILTYLIISHIAFFSCPCSCNMELLCWLK